MPPNHNTQDYQPHSSVFQASRRNKLKDVHMHEIVIFRSIIQTMDKQRILCFLILLVLGSCQLTGPEGHCLGYCSNCDPYALSSCRGRPACLWGFYSPQNNEQCLILPSLQMVSQELGERSESTIVPYFTGWGGEAKLSKCEYLSVGRKKTVDVLGLFQGSISVEKEFTVPLGAEMLELSFSLLRDEWLPLNDFLMIEIADHSTTLEMFEVSYETRSGPTPQNINITCNRTHVKVEQFRIRINKTETTDKIRVIFSSFLYDAVWGLTNVKLIAGCSGFSRWDSEKGTCSLCPEGSYFEERYQGFGECKSCPSLCKTCKDDRTCLSCSWGSLQDGKCVVSSTYKTKSIDLSSEVSTSTCRGKSIFLNDLTKKLTLPSVRNEQNDLYDEMVLSLTFFYDPFESADQGSVTIKINGETMMNHALQKEHTFTDQCQLFKSGRMAKLNLVGHSIPVNDNAAVVTVQAEGVQVFGVADVVLYSINKGSLGQEQQNQNPKDQDNQDIEQQGVNEEQVLDSPPQNKTSEAELIVSSDDGFQKITPAVNPTSEVFNIPESTAPPLSQTFSFSTSSSGLLNLAIRNLSEPITGLIVVQINKLLPSDYELIQNYYSQEDLIIVLKVLKSFKDGIVTVKELSGKVGRLLQQVHPAQIVAKIPVDRFDHYEPSEIQTIQTFSAVFSVFAWFGLIAIVMAILTGFGVVSENYVISLQMLFLHAFIGFQISPLTFKSVIGGLRGLGFLNYFASPPTNSGMQMTPETRFWLIPSEFNFTLAFLPILISLFLYALWFGLLVSLKKWVFPRSIPDHSRTKLHVLADGIVCRVINFIDAIWRYQLIAVLMVCLFEFVGAHRGGKSTQTFFAIMVALITVGWLVFSQIYIRNQYYQNEYSEFIYQFEDRYYCKIPLHSLPSRHHRLGYPLMRVGKALLLVLLVTLISHPLLAVILILSVNVFQLWYVHFNSIYSDLTMLKFKTLQNCLFIFLQLFLFLVLVSKSSLSAQTFKNWGYCISCSALLVILNSVVRLAYIARCKYLELKGVNFQQVDIDQKKLQTERAV